MKQQYTTLLPLNGIKGGRKTSCLACQQQRSKKQKKRLTSPTFDILQKENQPERISQFSDLFKTTPNLLDITR